MKLDLIISPSCKQKYKQTKKPTIATNHHITKYQLRLRVFSLALSTVGHIMVKIFEAPVYLQPPSASQIGSSLEFLRMKIFPEKYETNTQQIIKCILGGSQIFQPPFRAKSLKFLPKQLIVDTLMDTNPLAFDEC